MTNWIIFDLDGTLSDTEHRIHHARARDWDAFHAGIVLDKPRKAESLLLKAMYGLPSVDGIALVTGRPDKYRAATTDWLVVNGLFPYVDELHMRPNGDFRRDVEVKAEIYHQKFVGRGRNVLFVVEDRDRVVAMWRSLGLTCFQCQPGGY